ncbi:hypothetical protein [Kaistella sp.]|uniref:hypothetical protein n=1 Tax=Kaistella sp. TaxID=2782235 RepID=UPI003C45AFAB
MLKHEVYGVDMEKTGHVFALVDYKDVHAKTEQIECLLCNDLIVTYVDERSLVEKIFMPGIFEKYKVLLKTLTKESLYLIFGFLIFLNISMLNIKKFL